MCGKNQHFGYLNMLGSTCSIEGNIGDVGTTQRLDALVNIVGTLVVAMETNIREIGFYKSRLKIGNTHTCVSHINTQAIGQGLDSSLCGTINTTTCISSVASHTTYVNNMTMVEANHLWNNKTRHVEQTLYVGVNHLVPVLKTTFVLGLKTTRKTSIIDEHINRLETLGDAVDSLASGIAVANIKRKSKNRNALGLELGLKRLKLVGCTARNYNIVATIGKTTCTSLAYSTCGTSDKSCFSFHDY